MIKNTLPNKSENPRKPRKIIIGVGRSSTNVHIVGEDLLRVFCKLLYLQFCVSSDQ